MKYLIAIIILAGISAGLSLWVWNINTDELDIVRETHFTGRVYLEGEEYTEFKKELAARPELKINEMEVMSSPNALIDFSIAAEGDVDFQYGEKKYSYVDDMEGARVYTGMVSFLCLAFSISIISAITKES